MKDSKLCVRAEGATYATRDLMLEQFTQLTWKFMKDWATVNATTSTTEDIHSGKESERSMTTSDVSTSEQ